MVVALAPVAPAWRRSAGAEQRSRSETSHRAVDCFFAIHADGSVTLYSGKVDLGTGLRIAIPQMAAEELGVAVERIAMIEGDSALTPDQGPTAGRTGIMRGRHADPPGRGDRARSADPLGAERSRFRRRSSKPPMAKCAPKSGGPGVGFGALIGDRRFGLKLDANPKLKSPRHYTIVGKPLPRPDLPAKVTGRHIYMHDFKLPNMLHARVIRLPSIGATLASVDDASIAQHSGCAHRSPQGFPRCRRRRRMERGARHARPQGAMDRTAPAAGSDGVRDWLRAGPFTGDEVISKKGDAPATLPPRRARLAGHLLLALQSHALDGPVLRRRRRARRQGDSVERLAGTHACIRSARAFSTCRKPVSASSISTAPAATA